MRLLARLSWIAMTLAAAHVVVGVGMLFVPNPEGWVGGIFYALSYALPLFLIALALRSSQRMWRTAAGWVAVVLAAYYSLVVVGNWSGYSNLQAIFAVAITVPTVALDLVIFWAAALHRSGRPARSTPVTS